MSTLFGNKICSFYIILKQHFEKEIYIITAIYGKFHYETQTQQTERKSPSKSKEFQRKYFPSCYASGRVYLEKKAIQKNSIQKNFCFKKPTQYNKVLKSLARSRYFLYWTINWKISRKFKFLTKNNFSIAQRWLKVCKM